MLEEFKKDSERQAEFLLTEEPERTDKSGGFIGIDFAFDKIGLTLNTTINDFTNFMKDRASEAK